MATGVTSQKLASKLAIESYDHDPGATTAVVTSADGGTTPKWVAMANYGAFGVIAKPTVVAANGITLLEIVAATDAAGTDVTVVLAHAASITDALTEYVWLECTDEQVKEVGAAAGKNFTHVAARLTMATNTDEACVTYIRGEAKRASSGLTATNTAA
jgi:aspartokinase